MYTHFYLFNADLPLTLVVLQYEMYVTELDSGYDSVVTVCFNATVSEQRRREAVFELVLDNTTTATLDYDFFPNNTDLFITIPSGFYGNFSDCVDLVIVGDNLVEDDELVVYDLVPLSDKDYVMFPGGLDSISVTIIDNDGKGIIIIQSFKLIGVY